MDSLRQLLWDMKAGYKDQTAFLLPPEAGRKAVSYEEFLADTEQRTAYFRRLPESRIGLWGYNSYEWVVTAFGLLLAGKHVILFDANLGVQELLALAAYTDAEALAADGELMEEQEEIGVRLSMWNYEEAFGTEPGEPAGEFREEPEADLICFTSGTSKSAKGVVISAENLAGWTRMAAGYLPGKPGERYFLPLPLHHIYGFTELFHVLWQGSTICLGRGGRYLREDIRWYQPQVCFLVPSMLSYLLERDEFPPSVYTVAVGGSSLRPALSEAARQRGLILYNLYGLSETMGAICSSAPDGDPQLLEPFRPVRLLEGMDGELGVYLPFPMEGYYKKEEDTKAVLNRDGHIFWTGDAVRLEGRAARICGRMRDTIVLENGEKIHAEDVDAQLTALAGVREAAVIGVDGGLTAVLVPEPGTDREAIRRELERFNRMRPADSHIRGLWLREGALPRTSAGKLRRFLLEQEYKKKEM